METCLVAELFAPLLVIMTSLEECSSRVTFPDYGGRFRRIRTDDVAELVFKNIIIIFLSLFIFIFIFICFTLLYLILLYCILFYSIYIYFFGSTCMNCVR